MKKFVIQDAVDGMYLYHLQSVSQVVTWVKKKRDAKTFKTEEDAKKFAKELFIKAGSRKVTKKGVTYESDSKRYKIVKA